MVHSDFISDNFARVDIRVYNAVSRAVASLTVPGGQEFHFPHFFLKFWSIFLRTSYFLPHFGLLGGRVAHPGRPWLRHWRLATQRANFGRRRPMQNDRGLNAPSSLQ